MRSFSSARLPIVLCLLVILAAGIVMVGRTGIAVHASGSTAGISLSPTYGPPDATCDVSGTGFGSTETVTITFDAKVVATTTTDSKGHSFKLRSEERRVGKE